MNLSKMVYGLSALPERLRTTASCPSCSSKAFDVVDWKGFHSLHRCENCELLYRFPVESGSKMLSFYQEAYDEPGLTTEIPSKEELDKLLAEGFETTDKSFAGYVDIFKALGILPGARVLDFGTSWGYGLAQIVKAGYDGVGYEISKPRAAAAAMLDVDVKTDWAEIEQCEIFDLCFSSHVLEHVPDPWAAIEQQLSMLKDGGYLIAVFPHGSDELRNADKWRFHKIWGRVHPVLITDKFLDGKLSKYPRYYGSFTPQLAEDLKAWDRKSFRKGSYPGTEFLLIVKKEQATSSAE